MKTKYKATIIAIIVAISSILLSTSAHAMSESEMYSNITKRVDYQNLKTCYDIMSTPAYTTYAGAEALFLPLAGSTSYPQDWPQKTGSFCRGFVAGLVNRTPKNEAEMGEILATLGYVKDNNYGAVNEAKCSYGTFNYQQRVNGQESPVSENYYTTPTICYGTNSGSDTVVALSLEGQQSASAPIYFQDDGSQLLIKVNFGDLASDNMITIPYKGSNITTAQFTSTLTDRLANLTLIENSDDPNNINDYRRFTFNGLVTSNEDTSSYEKIGKYDLTTSSLNTGASNLLGITNGYFSTDEQVSLYQFYVAKNGDTICDPEGTLDSSYTKVKLVIQGKYYDNCYSRESTDSGVYYSPVGLGSGNNIFLGSNSDKITYAEVLNRLNSLTAGSNLEAIISPNAKFNSFADPIPVDPTPEGQTEGQEGGSNNNTDNVCYGADGTLGMSWLVCPIATAMYKTLDGIYDYTEKHFLKMDNSEYNLFNSDTYSAWRTFQTIANVIVVIFLLVVIFSQLTGIGIDNYGIKKILPRLIIVAILINLSYIIAQLAVDASNIIGASLGSFFENLASGGSSVSTGSAVAVGAISVIGVGIVAATVFANPALVLSFLLTLLTAIVSVVMMFAILVAREVGVVVAIVIAPVAFACYLLPNTSRWTKSWANLLKGLLLLYPLCSLLIGASVFVSGLIANTGGSWTAFAAILIRVVPFFMLPTLFRKTLNAVGNLGTQIQGIGRGINQGIARTRNADWYKNTQQISQERANRYRAGYNADGSERNGFFARTRRSIDNSKVGQTFGWQRSRRSATEAYLKAQNERQRDEYLRNPDNVQATLYGQEARWEKEQVDNQSVLLDKGQMLSIDGGGATVGDSPEQIKEELVKRLSQSAEHQAAHYAENSALWKKLQSFKDKGYDKTADLWGDTRITDSNSRLMQEIKSDVRANGDFKNGARTAYDVITSDAPRDPNAITVARATGASLDNLRMERIPDFSGDELESLSKVARGIAVTDPQGNIYVPSQEKQLQASQLLLSSLSDSQIARRYKGADADMARLGAVKAFEFNFNNLNHSRDIDVSFERKDANGIVTDTKNLKQTPEGLIYDPTTNKVEKASDLAGYERKKT